MAASTVQTIEIDAPREDVFAVAADVARYPDWATGIKQADVLAEDGSGRPLKVAFRVDGMVKEIGYTLLYSYEEPGSISWEAEPGADIKEMEGSYTFNHLDGDRTEVVYALRAEPAFSIPGFLRKQVEKQIVGTALRGLRARVEELAGG